MPLCSHTLKTHLPAHPNLTQFFHILHKELAIFNVAAMFTHVHKHTWSKSKWHEKKHVCVYCVVVGGFPHSDYFIVQQNTSEITLTAKLWYRKLVDSKNILQLLALFPES